MIQLLDPKPLLNPLPPRFDIKTYCEYHRS